MLDGFQFIHGALFFNIAMAICSFLMCHEFYKAMEEKGFKPIKIFGYLCTLFLIPIGVVQTYTLMMICASLIPLIVIVGLSITVISRMKYNIVDVAITLFGAIYTILMCAFLSATRAMPLGVFLIFYIFCGAWFSDIFAYLIGRKIGKHKFSTISPKKSIEGCIAGVIGSIVFVVGYSAILNNIDLIGFEKSSEKISIVVKIEEDLALNKKEEIKEDIAKKEEIIEDKFAKDEEMYNILKDRFFTNYPLLILLGIIVSVISQIGDLAASAIKRFADIKDFSHLMPGHGGMLDRFDSVLFVAPVVYYTIYIIQHL